MTFISNNAKRLFIIYFILSISSLLLYSCADSSHTSDNDLSSASAEAGSVSFKILWPEARSESFLIRAESPSGDVCVDYNINTIIIDIYDSSGQVVNSQSISCDEHTATISNVPAGPDMWLMLSGIVSETPQWRGLSETFTLVANETADAGAVNMNYIGDDTIRPMVDSTTPADGSTNVSLNAQITAKFTEDVVSASVLQAFTLKTSSIDVNGSVTYDSKNQTATFTPDHDLSGSTEYTATIISSTEDLAGNQMAEDYTWRFTTASIDAPSVTADSATLVTEKSARLNGLVNPNGLSTSYCFEYGTDSSYGSTTALADAGSGGDPISVFADISGLNPNTEYHFRIVATNAGGTTNGSDGYFHTDTIWAKTYGGVADDSAYYIQQTSDNGYIIAGYTESFGAGDYDIWVLKLNADGKVAWEKTFGGANRDFCESIQQTAEGGYIVAGYTESFGAGSVDLWILKLGADGTAAWARTYGGTNPDYSRSIQQTSDGGFIVSGNTSSFGAGARDIWILKINVYGVIAWQKAYGGTVNDESFSIQQTSDGGYLVAGRTESFGAGGYDIWVLKLNADGTVAWQKTYGGRGYDSSESILQAADGGYIVAGNTYSFGAGSNDIWILKLNADGTVAWQKTYGGEYYDFASFIQQTLDGGYIVVGSTQNFRNELDNDIWILKLNAEGTVAWQKTYGGTYSDIAGSIRQTSDEGYVVVGSTTSFGAGTTLYGDIWVLKIGEDGSLGCGFGVDSSALIFTPDASGSPTAATVSDTSSSAVFQYNPSNQDSTALVDTQCP